MCASKRVRNTSDHQLCVKLYTIYISLCIQTADPKYSEPLFEAHIAAQKNKILKRMQYFPKKFYALPIEEIEVVPAVIWLNVARGTDF